MSLNERSETSVKLEESININNYLNSSGNSSTAL